MAPNKKMTTLGRIALFAAALKWGISFVVLKNILDNISPLYILAIRFSGAALILLPACIGRKIDKAHIGGGMIMGAALFLAYASQTYGLNYTTPGKNAFLTAIYCIIVPFLYWIYMKKRPDRFNAIAALICFIGIGFISIDGDMRIGLGDSLTILGGLFFAVHIVITAKVVEGRSPGVLAMLQFATVGFISAAGAFLFEPFPVTATTQDWLSILFLTVVCTAGCLSFQAFGQKYTPPSQASIILTLESVLGALTSVLLMYEVLSLRLLIGFALTFAAVMISETKPGFLGKKR